MSSSSQPAANTVPDSQLGLTNEEIQILRHAQQAVAAAGSSSSRAASRASSQGRLIVDSSSLAALGQHFDRVMQRIQIQLERLTQEATEAYLIVQDRIANLVENVDREMERYAMINAQLDELELDFDRIRHIREIVSDYRRRAEELDRELDRSGGGNSSRRHHHHGHHSSHRSHGHSSSGKHRR